VCSDACFRQLGENKKRLVKKQSEVGFHKLEEIRVRALWIISRFFSRAAIGQSDADFRVFLFLDLRALGPPNQLVPIVFGTGFSNLRRLQRLISSWYQRHELTEKYNKRQLKIMDRGIGAFLKDEFAQFAF
jgi:hypothetical protein